MGFVLGWEKSVKIPVTYWKRWLGSAGGEQDERNPTEQKKRRSGGLPTLDHQEEGQLSAVAGCQRMFPYTKRGQVYCG